MNTITMLAAKAGKYATDNSPLILTAIGVSGTVTTAYLAAKASFKAERVLREAALENAYSDDAELTTIEEVKLVWTLYIPAVTTGCTTIAAIILAHRISGRRAAAVAAAFSLSEKAFEEYREKIVETLGKNKEQKARDDIAQTRVNNDFVGNHQVVITGGGDVLCYELYTGRYFNSSMETIKKAQNDLNYKVLNSYYASLSDFYNLLGLSNTGVSDDVGWNADELLELEFSTVMSDDQRPCLAFNFRVHPIRGYSRIH